MDIKIMPLVILLYLLFASVFTIAKMGLQYTQPFFLVGTRMLMAGTLLLSFLFFFRRTELSFRRQDLFAIGCLAIFNIYLTNALEFWGLKYLTSFKTCFIYSLSPFLAALLSYFLFSEKLSAKKWIGLAIGMAGFIPLLTAHSLSEEQAGHLFFLSWPELAVMGAAATSVYGWVLMKKLVMEGGYSPLMLNGISMLLGGFFSMGHSFFVEEWKPVPVVDTLPFLGAAILLTIISNLICYNLYGYLLKKYSATFMSFAGFMTPLFTAFFGWLVLGEKVSLPFYLSFVIVLWGLILFHRDELKASAGIVLNQSESA